MSGRWFQRLDTWLHFLHVPYRLMWRICDAYDMALGTPDTPENFPTTYRKRHPA